MAPVVFRKSLRLGRRLGIFIVATAASQKILKEKAERSFQLQYYLGGGVSQRDYKRAAFGV
jgi:hypothetical protein